MPLVLYYLYCGADSSVISARARWFRAEPSPYSEQQGPQLYLRVPQAAAAKAGYDAGNRDRNLRRKVKPRVITQGPHAI